MISTAIDNKKCFMVCEFLKCREIKSINYIAAIQQYVYLFLMQLIRDIKDFLDSIAPPQLQESYDNAGLLTGNLSWECTGVLCTLDVTEEVISEAVNKKINLVVAHHPIIFKGLKKLT